MAPFYDLVQQNPSNVLGYAAVRAPGDLGQKYFNKSPFRGEQVIIQRDDWEVVLTQLASTA